MFLKIELQMQIPSVCKPLVPVEMRLRNGCSQRQSMHHPLLSPSFNSSYNLLSAHNPPIRLFLLRRLLHFHYAVFRLHQTNLISPPTISHRCPRNNAWSLWKSTVPSITASKLDPKAALRHLASILPLRNQV